MRRLVTSSCAATLLLIGGLAVGSQVGTAGQAQTVPSTEPAVATTEVAMTTEAAAATEAPAATEPAATEAPATTEAVAATDAESTEAETAASTEGHPLVGAWMLVDEANPGSAPFLASFSSDGIYIQTDAAGTGYGAWEATGPSSAAVTFVIQLSDDEGGDAGRVTIRATGEVGPDGQTFTGEYTIEFVGGGAPPGEHGPGSVTGTRIVVEPMGTPAGSIEDLFGGFEEGADVSAPPTTTS